MSGYSKGFRDAWAESVSDVDQLTASITQIQARAERAESELARVGPAVAAAEALVEQWEARPSWKVDWNDADVARREVLENALAEKVKEAQR